MPEDRPRPVSERGLKAGDVLHLTRDASPQFTRPIWVRVIRELPDRHTYDGWLWFEAYELGSAGRAVAKRELFVRREGVRRLATSPTLAARRQPRPERTAVNA